jgi:hypothetical protein
MGKTYLSTTHLTLIVSVLLAILIAAPARAVKTLYQSKLNGGVQLWIEAVDFDVRDKNKQIQTGNENKRRSKEARQPWLGDDVIFSIGGGFTEYKFKSPVAGPTHIYGRVMDLRGGGQSWYIALNERIVCDGCASLVIDTQGGWTWNSGRDGSRSKNDLKKGKNFVYVTPRESGPGTEPFLDIIVLSTVQLRPTDAEFQAIKERGLAVEPEEKLATTWGALKRAF